MTDDTMVEQMKAVIAQAGDEFDALKKAEYDDNAPSPGLWRDFIATALLPLVREAQAEALTAFIAEADKSPAITWTGKGGVKELATARAATYRKGDDHE